MAVRQDGMALPFVKNQNPAICTVAVQQNIDAMQYIRDSEMKKISEMLVQDQAATISLF